jgi:23S rRNA pseudouridine2605 synthase
LLFTNDGSLTEKLTHPSYQIKKIYQIELDKSITKLDFEKLNDTITLEDGPVKIDNAAILTTDKRTIGLEIHIGKNRVVRRIFENLGYEVIKLDRTMYGPLTKKDLPRGKWRFLSDKELIVLRNLS